jgi:hypothetical protein
MKLTKRQFVKGTAAVAVALSAIGAAPIRRSTLAAPRPPEPRAIPVSESPSFDVFVYNDWFPQAREFADNFPATRVLKVDGDAGQLWYGTLRGLVITGLRHIAGVTSHTDLLILETLAREAGLKVRSRNESGRLVYWTLTP